MESVIADVDADNSEVFDVSRPLRAHSRFS